MEKLVSAVEVAEHLQINVDTVRRLAREGTIPSTKVGRQVRFSLSQVMHYLTSTQEKARTV